jgi:hypothetical protein
MSTTEIRTAQLPSGWTEGWRARLHPPGKWWMATHTSGYTVGEVDAGRYMIADPSGEGVFSEAGDWISFSNALDAMEHVEMLSERSVPHQGGGE